MTEFNWADFAQQNPEAMKPVLEVLGWTYRNGYFIRVGWDHYNDCEGIVTVDNKDAPGLIRDAIVGMVLDAELGIDPRYGKERNEIAVYDEFGNAVASGDTLDAALAEWLKARA